MQRTIVYNVYNVYIYIYVHTFLVLFSPPSRSFVFIYFSFAWFPRTMPRRVIIVDSDACSDNVNESIILGTHESSEVWWWSSFTPLTHPRTCPPVKRYRHNYPVVRYTRRISFLFFFEP